MKDVYNDKDRLRLTKDEEIAEAQRRPDFAIKVLGIKNRVTTVIRYIKVQMNYLTNL